MTVRAPAPRSLPRKRAVEYVQLSQDGAFDLPATRVEAMYAPDPERPRVTAKPR